MTNDAPILLDVTRLIWRRWKGRLPTGIDRVCLAYLRHFGERAQAVVQHKRFRRILDRDPSRALFDLLEGPPNRFRMRLPGAIVRHLGELDCPDAGRLYLNIGHTGLNSAGFREWVQRTGVRPVYLVHDLIPVTHPEFCRAGEGERHRDRMRSVLTTARAVIGNSQVTLDELASFADAEALPVPPAIAAWLGIDPLPAIGHVPAPERPTFVSLGTIEARKNHLMLLEIWSRLIDRLGSNAPRLLIIGQRGWEADQVFDRLDKDHKLRGHVVELSRCADDELAGHLASARALLFPSLAEGFGLPLVEALAAGTPVIASDLAVLREIGGNVPAFLGPRDAAAWEDAILDFAQPESVARRGQLQRIEGFTVPTWQAHFEKIEAWLSSLDAPAST